MKVETVYAVLKGLGLVKSAYEFSENYLGKKKNYLSVIRARKIEPSIEVTMTLVEALRLAATYIQAGDREDLKEMKSKLRVMSKEVKKELEERCRCNLWHYF
jgi:hypothetical protein